MTALVWNVGTEKVYESGLDQGVLYVRDANGAYPLGVPWEGLTAVTESPGGAEPTDLWANNTKYATLTSTETLGGSIEAYTFPDEFMACDGTLDLDPGVTVGQQARKTFGLAYRTRVGNEAGGDMVGYKIHLVYGCKASPSERAYNSVNDSPEAVAFSWDFTTTPVSVSGQSPTSMVVIDTTKADPAIVTWINEQLFGAEAVVANLPLPDAIKAFINAL